MSFVPYKNKQHAGFKKTVLLLGCLLAQQSTFARSERNPVLFQAASLPTSNAPADAVFTDGRAESESAFIPLMLKADTANIRALIASLEDGGDFFSPRIAELSSELGKALQLEGEHRAALEAYDRSFQINRRQEGLASAAQTAILQAKINSQIALGNMDASDALQHSLFLMQQQVLAEKPVALAEANLKLADWNLQYFLQARQTPTPGGRTDAQEAALSERLGEAFMQYHTGLWLISTAAVDGMYEKKVAIERKIAALTLMVNRQSMRAAPNTLTKFGQRSIHQTKRAHHPVLTNHGSAALLRAVEYSMATAEPALIAERQLELADWYLLMDQYDEARATYATAVASLRDAGVQEQQITTILESGLPVHDPETALLALASGEAIRNFDDYIDVTFDLNRSGKASNARVLARSSLNEQVEEALLRQIHDDRFRPGFDQGSPVDLANVTLRYYFAR